MKIGILTYHRSHNYGALLQAVALRYQLVKMGHEVYFIDYWPKYHQRMYAYFSFYKLTHQGIRGAFWYLYRFAKFHRQKKEKITKFESFIRQYINPYCKGMEETFDVVVHGSDQIWRKQEGKAYNPVYFGIHNNIKSKFNVSYSASMGKISRDENDMRIVKNYLSHLDKISVREADLLSFVQKLGYNDASLDMDPTFLLLKTDWDKLIPEKPCGNDRYILYYKLLDGSFYESDIYEFAKERNFKVKVLYGFATITKESDNSICTAEPSEFLNLVRHAEFIFTSSYHGLAFSLIYSKPFYAAFSINSERAASILKKLHLEDKLLKPMARIPRTYSKIDYLRINEAIQRMGMQSVGYLRSLDRFPVDHI